MEKTIEINDRLFNQISEYCDTNYLFIDEYLRKLIEEGFYIDKYGDLNILRNEVLNIDVPDVFLKSAEFIRSTNTLRLTMMNGSQMDINCENLIDEIENSTENSTENVKTDAKNKKMIIKRKIESK